MERVQTVASSWNEDLPPEFIRPENEQPRFTTYEGQPLQIPVVDFKVSDEKNLVQTIFDASSKWGLFQIVNHGIPSEVIGNLQRVGKQFFELSQEEKEAYAKDPESNSIEGYGTKLQKSNQGKKGWVDHLFNKVWPPEAVDYRFWPRNPPDYRKATEEYAKHLHEVVDNLLKYLSLGLGLAAEELKSAVGGAELVYNLKINYYPPCPRPDLALGVPAHSDLCGFTILVPSEVHGLQVFRDEVWYDVAYVPNALIIHIGDQIEIFSNGKYKAVLHRSTVNKEKTRMSWPVFIEPPPNLEVGPHPKLINEQNPPKYKTKKFCDYAYCKLNKIPQ
ncbi:Iron/ascorbate family oxidoreductase [Handroanthus impetiginosus]|uniref:Iron/ascorbate family oxidoreductase n=1 Tax=Handroanthus impetiginosus TaxID=429701 RepID=A0A2G9H1K2_9LAMI|nr:Iron/ascorbate family oxidoreductase [Handroanthus impetiginosus]